MQGRAGRGAGAGRTGVPPPGVQVMVATGWARRSGLHPASRPLRGAQEALAKSLRREERNRPLFLSSLIISKYMLWNLVKNIIIIDRLLVLQRYNPKIVKSSKHARCVIKLHNFLE